LAFRIGSAGELSPPTVAFQAPAGSGPRFMVFHPRLAIAYLVSELASTLTVLEIAGDGLRARATISTLPDDFAGESLGGHVVMDAEARHLYVTNRGHDSIAAFALSDDGLPRLLQHVASGGASPRFLLIGEGGARLFVANEEGGTVATLAIDDAGRLTPVGSPVAVPGAAFLCPDRSA
jgi:6-phosphogluconolactonase